MVTPVGDRTASEIAIDNELELDIMQRIALQDPAALAELYDLYASRVFGLCLRFLLEDQLAEDAVQDVFLRVWERAHLFDGLRGPVRPWLMSITRNLCIDKQRRIQARPKPIDPPLGSEAQPIEETLADPMGSVPEIAAKNEEAVLIRHALAALVPEQRLVIELSFFEGLTRRKIAARLHWPEGSVHTRARLALHNLRRNLDALGVTPD